MVKSALCGILMCAGLVDFIFFIFASAPVWPLFVVLAGGYFLTKENK